MRKIAFQISLAGSRVNSWNRRSTRNAGRLLLFMDDLPLSLCGSGNCMPETETTALADLKESPFNGYNVA